MKIGFYHLCEKVFAVLIVNYLGRKFYMWCGKFSTRETFLHDKNGKSTEFHKNSKSEKRLTEMNDMIGLVVIGR